MGEIVSIHSFRGGTGKSNLVANLSAILAAQGKRIAIIDTDIQSPGLHVLFGVDVKSVQLTFTDYLLGRCDVKEAALEVTQFLSEPEESMFLDGKIYLLPSSMKVDEITTILSEGYDISLLTRGYENLIQTLKLDYLIVDTHPGINEETLLSIGISSRLIIILRLDHQDYQGTAITVHIARQLDVPKMSLVVNKVLPELDFEEVTEQIESSYNVSVVGVLPLERDMMQLGSQEVFSICYPDHSLTQEMKRIAEWILSS